MVWKVVFILFEDLLKLGVNIVIDATNLTKWYRKKYLNILQKYDYTKIALVLPKIGKEESINRRMNDPHGKEDRNVWEDIWTRFDLSYEEPTKEEGFDEIIYLE
jgi:predicted kinase